jgi:uncharacterized membrane protein
MDNAGRGSAWDRARTAAGRIRLEYLFLVIALVWGTAQVFIVPPLQVPDEGDHWFRAWAIADGQIFADRQGMVRLPGSFAPAADLYQHLALTGKPLPLSLAGQPGFSGYEQLFNGSGSPGTIKVISRVASYGPAGYLPQVAGIEIGRLLGAPPLTSFYLARLGNLLAAVALLFFAIRLAPFGKQLFLLLALLPMTMFEFASVSSDALTTAGAMFFISLLLWASRRETLRGRDLALVLGSSALLLNVKPGYWALLLLLLLLRPAQLGGRPRYVAFVVANVFVAVGVFLAIFMLTAVEARASAAGGANAQLLFILHQPLAFARILLANIRHNGIKWGMQTIGVLGWLRINLWPGFYLFVVAAGLGFVFCMKEDVGLQRRQRALLAAAGVAVFLTMAVALYAFLEPVGSTRVFFQGRYLAPVVLLLLLSIYGIRFAHRRLGLAFVTGVLVVIFAVNMQALISAYHL